MQLYQPMNVRCFWLAVLIRNLAAHGAQMVVATACAQFLIWFLWHFTADAVPPALRPLLCAHATLYGTRADGGAQAQCGHSSLCVCDECNRYRHLQYGKILQWLLQSDTAAAGHVQHSVFDTPSGAALEELQAALVCEVCTIKHKLQVRNTAAVCMSTTWLQCRTMPTQAGPGLAALALMQLHGQVLVLIMTLS